MKVKFKGGNCNFCSKKIYMTSFSDPETWFVKEANREAFFEKVTSIIEVI